MRYKILILVPNQLYKSSTGSPKDVPVGQFLSHSCIILMFCLGDCKARNETEMKRNETKRDTTEKKQDKAETKRNEARPNETIKIINK